MLKAQHEEKPKQWVRGRQLSIYTSIEHEHEFNSLRLRDPFDFQFYRCYLFHKKCDYKRIRTHTQPLNQLSFLEFIYFKSDV